MRSILKVVGQMHACHTCAGVVSLLVSKLTGFPAVRAPISLPLSPDSSQIHKHITGDFQVRSHICCGKYESRPIGYVRTTLGYHSQQNKWRQNKTFAGSHEVGFGRTRAKIRNTF